MEKNGEKERKKEKRMIKVGKNGQMKKQIYSTKEKTDHKKVKKIALIRETELPEQRQVKMSKLEQKRANRLRGEKARASGQKKVEKKRKESRGK